VVYTQEITMKELLQMAEAHLLNVQREVQKLEEQKQGIENDIKALNDYLTSSVEHVNSYREQIKPINTTISPDV
jgi:peptidoglycan hydrolase CwlO-like protein